jgi:WD40 repeat protein
MELDDCVISAAWSPDGRRLAAATASGTVVVVDASDGSVHQQLPGHNFGATTVAWSRTGSRLASAGQDGTIQFWDCATGRQLAAVDGGSSWVEHLAWCPVLDELASAAGRIVRVWNADGELVREYAPLSNTASALAWRPGARRLAVSSYGGITMWEGEQLEPIRRFRWKGSIVTMSWSPDSRYLATGDQDSTVHFWIVRTGRDLQMWGYPRKVRELSWDRTSRYLATGGGAVPTIWDCAGKGPEGTKPIQLAAHEVPLTVLTYQHAGPLLASADEDGEVFYWRPAGNNKPLARTGLRDSISHMSWSPDDRLMALGSGRGELAVAEVGEG